MHVDCAKILSYFEYSQFTFDSCYFRYYIHLDSFVIILFLFSSAIYSICTLVIMVDGYGIYGVYVYIYILYVSFYLCMYIVDSASIVRSLHLAALGLRSGCVFFQLKN